MLPAAAEGVRGETGSVIAQSLEAARRTHHFCAVGYVVMPEHVHLLATEPETGMISTALQALKRAVSCRLALCPAESF